MKKSISIIQSCLVMALVILLAFFTFMPVITVNTDKEENFMKEYEEGYFTKDADVPKSIDIGVGEIIKAIPNMPEIIDVIDIQFSHAFMESSIESISKEITKIGLEENTPWEEKETRIIALREDIEELRANFAAKITKLGESEIENIKQKLEDEEFRAQVSTLYGIIGLLDWDHDALTSDTVPVGTYPGEFPIVEMFAVAAFIIVLILFAIVMAVIFTVKAISKLVKFIIGMIKGDFRMTEKLSSDLPYSAFVGPILMCFAVAFFFVGESVTLGSAVFPFILIALLIGLMRIIDFTLFDCKSNMAIINTAVKKVLTLTALVLSILFIFNFAGLGIYGEMMETYETYHETRSDELLEIYSAQMEPDRAIDKANEDVESVGRLIYTYLPLLGIIFAAVIASAAVDRFGSCVLESKKDKKKEVGSQFVVAILLVAIAALPIYFSASSLTEMNNSHEKGDFVVFYDEYLYEGTKEYNDYNALKSNLEVAKSELEKNRDNMSTEEIVTANQVILTGEQKLSELETTEESNATSCLILAIAIAVIEIAYFVCAKILGKLAENAPERTKRAPKKKSAKKEDTKNDKKESAPALEDATTCENSTKEDFEDTVEEPIEDSAEEELPEEEVISAEEEVNEDSADIPSAEEATEEDAPIEDTSEEDAPIEDTSAEESIITEEASAPADEASEKENK